MNSLNQKGFQEDPLDHINKFKPMEAKRSKDEVWAELEKMIEKPLPKKSKVTSFYSKQWQIAASVVFMLLLAGVLGTRLYRKTVSTTPGKQQLAILPDGSEVQLNSQSEISFNPIWWRMSREVDLKGEAYFKVKKGKKFTVISDNGETSVVGTSFNIFARGDDYEVTCLTGKVRIKSAKTKEEVLIIPNQMVSFTNDGNIQLSSKVNAKLATNWIIGKFTFTRVPLDKVFSEIALRYGVEVDNLSDSKELYTGNFNKEKDIELVLNLVCKPFELEYKKQPSGAYIIQKKP
nr:FecR family protein [uncultured Pedobacter sp.]